MAKKKFSTDYGTIINNNTLRYEVVDKDLVINVTSVMVYDATISGTYNGVAFNKVVADLENGKHTFDLTTIPGYSAATPLDWNVTGGKKVGDTIEFTIANADLAVGFTAKTATYEATISGMYNGMPIENTLTGLSNGKHTYDLNTIPTYNSGIPLNWNVTGGTKVGDTIEFTIAGADVSVTFIAEPYVYEASISGTLKGVAYSTTMYGLDNAIHAFDLTTIPNYNSSEELTWEIVGGTKVNDTIEFEIMYSNATITFTAEKLIPVEYVMLDGLTQAASNDGYITTNFTPDLADVTKYKIVSERTYIGANTTDFEGCSGSDALARMYYGRSEGNLNVNTPNYYAPVLNLAQDTKYTMTLDYKNNIIDANGVNKTNVLTIPTAQPLAFSILGRTEGSRVTPIKNTVAHATRIYKDDVLLHNFVPCKRVSDNVIGVYDAVNKIFVESVNLVEYAG